MRSGILVYISGPITPKNGRTLEENVAAGVEVYRFLLLRGIPAILPHFNCLLPDRGEFLHYDQWMAYDYRLLDRCTHILMMPGWEQSAGACLELAYARGPARPLALGRGPMGVIFWPPAPPFDIDFPL